jgi:predicted dehydrogenase
MITIGIIGANGHQGEVLKEVRLNPGMYHISGIAPGMAGEDIGKLKNDLSDIGQTGYKEYPDMETLFNLDKPDIAVVCSYFSQNASISTYALEKNIHVLSEKPLATRIPDYSLLKKAADQSNAKIWAMLTYRYDPRFIAAKTAVLRGDIGGIRSMQAQKSYKLGIRPAFYRNRDTYGSTLQWVGIHAIDWLSWLSGSRFESVYAYQSNRDNLGNGDLETIAVALFTMDNDITATVNCDYYRPGKAPTHGDDRIRIVGTEGILEVTGDSVFIINGNGTIALPVPETISMFSDFLGYINGKDTRLTGPESFYATKASLLAAQSAESGMAVRF